MHAHQEPRDICEGPGLSISWALLPSSAAVMRRQTHDVSTVGLCVSKAVFTNEVQLLWIVSDLEHSRFEKWNVLADF